MNSSVKHGEVSLVTTTTFIGWLVCLAVGAAQWGMPYAMPHPPAKTPPPVEAKIMNVALSNIPLIVPSDESPFAPPALSEPEPAQPPPPVAIPSAPDLVAVAVPSPTIAFAQPVEGPTQPVAARDAVPIAPLNALSKEPSTHPVAPTLNVAHPSGPQKSQPGAVQRLVYGEGLGDQPKPDYPREAQLLHQEGVVIIRFTVGEDGRVKSAEIVSPCPYAMLNQAALRKIRDDWRYPSGPVRNFEIPMEFQLHQK
jgi:TonB family protein